MQDMHVHEMKDPNDPGGRTYREVNLARSHAIPIGTLVELAPYPEDDRWDGVRLYVVHHHRDCDGTPLYALAFDRHDTEIKRPGFHNDKWLHGMPESGLRIVKLPG
jgi:hypothetical protein